MIWKIRHGAIPTGRFLYMCKYSDSPNCNYCGELDDLTHSFVTCSRLSGLFQLTQSLIRILTPKFLFGGILLLSQLVLVLMLILDAYYATGFLRRQKLQLYIVQCRFNKAKVISRVHVEYQFARFQNTVCNFVERWNAYNVLCKVENDNNYCFNL